VTTTKEDGGHFHPCLILAHGDPVYAASACRAFRRLGWDVYLARTGPEVRRLARMLEPDLVVLDAELPEETGWLTCDKLTHEAPRAKVVLVDDIPDAQREQFAAFVGAAALVGRKAGMAPLLDEVRSTVLPAAG
jgi:DNA-binding response OmpR family regulator